jgi:hypothetical protein
MRDVRRRELGEVFGNRARELLDSLRGAVAVLVDTLVRGSRRVAKIGGDVCDAHVGACGLGRVEQSIDQPRRHPMRCGREDGGQVIRSDVFDDLVVARECELRQHGREVMKELRDRLVGWLSDAIAARSRYGCTASSRSSSPAT